MTIIAENLIVGWQKTAIAELSSLNIGKSEIVAIAGPNGVGKSTTVKTLARQMKPLAGKITINGTDIGSMPARDFAKLVAYVPQLMEAPHEMLVEELVALGRNPHHNWWSWQCSNSDQEAIKDALFQTGTAQLAKRPVGDLSGGERQRVAIAVALAQEPQFLILDEPTAHLDFKHQLQLLTLLQSLQNKGLGILLVLHDLNFISRLASKVILLSKQAGECSRIAACGEPAITLNKDVLAAVYEVEMSIACNEGQTIYSPLSLLPSAKDD